MRVNESRLTVVEVIRERGQKTKAICECQCGARKTLLLSQVTRGDVKSCGCLKRESSARSGKANRTHGQATPGKRGRTYRSWESMKARCLNSNSPSYPLYGGRGITVCQRWIDSFHDFLEDMGPRPLCTSIDRIDNNGNYEPSNCRWGTSKVQGRNKSANRIVAYQGRRITMAELAETTGMPYGLLYDRIVRHGWSVADAVTKPKRSWGG